MAGEAIEQIMQVGGWKTEAIARYYVERSDAKRRRARDYCTAVRPPRLVCHGLSRPILPYVFAVSTGPQDPVKTD